MLIPEGRDISDRKALERELVLRQTRFDAFFTAAPASMFIFDEQLRFVQVNEKLAETTGVSVAEHLGKTVREVIPEMIDTLQPMLQQVLVTNQPFLNVEVSGTTVNEPGVLRDWLASYFPLPGPDGKPIGVGGVAIEITDRKKAEATLRDSEERFRATVEQAAVGITHPDQTGRYLRVNQKFCEIVGYTASELLSRTWMDVTYPEVIDADLEQ
ncbi:PAS domain S-box protein, partial [Microcoleus sp. HI-ES]|nr:PAS domain S-box protein [Microcoleus sp. HI-ES]